jgi:hypothetical protein
MAEAGGMLIKSVITYVLLRMDYGLLAYSIGLLTYSVSLNLIYLIVIPLTFTFTFNKSQVSSLDQQSVHEFSKSCILKFLLQEGEKFMMIYLALL